MWQSTTLRGQGPSVAPERETADAIYSNFDHVIDEQVRDELKGNSALCAQHAAWDFCGYVWFDGELWHEEVWRWKSPVDHRTNADLDALISGVNGDYGDD